MRIAIARARHRHVDRKDQRLNPRRLRAFERVAHEAAILQHIELEPDRRAGLALHLVDRADRYRRQGEGHLLGRCCARGLNLTASCIHAGQPDRSQHHRHAKRLAKQGSGKIDVGNIAQHPLAQRHVGQVGDVMAKRMFGIGATVDIVEQERR